jgi:hypothetical protein
MAMNPDPSRITEDTAALVLERAAELDASHGREVLVKDLREAALEAGISPAAFERALGELASALDEPREHPDRPLSEVGDSPANPWSHRMRVLAGGLSLGLLAVVLNGVIGGAGIMFAFLLGLFAAIGLMLERKGKSGVLDFEVDLLMLWIGLTLLVIVTQGEGADEFLAFSTMLGAVTALFGGAVVALRRPEQPPLQLPGAGSIDAAHEGGIAR